MKADPIVDEGRRVREELVKKYGGLDGWIDHLQDMDKARVRRAKKHPVKVAETSAGQVRRRTPRKLVDGGVKG